MAIDLVALGAKCRRLRNEILAMTPEVAATRTGIDAKRLLGIEEGTIEPTGDEVLILADVYGEPVDYFITNEQSASIERATDLYRMYGSAFLPEDRQNIQEFLRLCRMEHEIELLLGTRPRVVKFLPTASDRFWKRHGEANATKLRGDLGLGDGPVDNLFHLPRRFGCHLFRRSLRNSGVSGLMLRHNEYGPCILVNYSEDLYRQNFSVAHELCHALLDVDCEVTVTFERESDETADGRKRREWRANAFASYLLFPQAAERTLELGGTVDELTTSVVRAARHYRVNPEVILYRLKETKRLTEEDVAALKPGLRIRRDDKVDSDLVGESKKVKERRRRHWESGLSPEYVETCVRAYRDGQISLGRLADALLVSPLELTHVLSDLGTDLTFSEVIT